MQVEEFIKRLDQQMGARIAAGEEAMELECRLGYVSGTEFVSAVDPLWFTTLHKRLEQCPQWSYQTQWVESEDTFFKDAQNRIVRQSRHCDPDSCQVSLHTVCKQNKQHVDIAVSDIGVQCNEILPSKISTLRVSVCDEHSVPTHTLPVVVVPVHVRIKQRKTFEYASTTHPGAHWRFELTRSWSGTTREEAETAQFTAPPSHEVEVEWHGGGVVLTDTAALLKSLIIKALSVLE
jgi:hypothetical protein